jgi:4,5-DOPA dioxygenase extradiol
MTAPVLFVSHGSPMVALEHDDYGEALAAFGAAAPSPRAVVCVSAHWEAPAPVRVAAAPRPATIHDFGGFPEALYRLAYPAPGDPTLAADVVARLREAGIPAVEDPRRGFDHGVWVPLRRVYPDAGVPVVPVSLVAGAPPADLLQVGRALAPLRDQGVLVMGSGGVVHNLGRLDRHAGREPVTGWARVFDDWVRERLAPLDLEALAAYRRQAPHADLAVPTTEHFDPQFVALGAPRPGDRLADVYTGFRHGSLSMRTVAWEPAA